jgi:4-hydroxythreonine-4-phosphate dehydrogenase
MTRPILGITMGDPAGIGAEIAVKALTNPQLYNDCIPVVIGDFEALKDAKEFTNAKLILHEVKNPGEAIGVYGTLDYINMGFLKPGSWEYKKVGALMGKAAFGYIKRGIELALEGKIHGVVTGPINKESLNLAGYHYSGHTEIFAELTNTKDYCMMLTSPELRVVHVTTHVSMRDACNKITRERVLVVIKLADEACRMLGIEKRRVAVAGLNPHCSENGLFGFEEEREIIPAIEDAKDIGIDVEGPIPPDTVFVKAIAGQYEIVVAMYHDQGHIPIKLMGFKLDKATNKYTSMTGVNSTIGLPVIRTSVDHGTAFGKAGENRANEQSLVDAITTATLMANIKIKQLDQ